VSVIAWQTAAQKDVPCDCAVLRKLIILDPMEHDAAYLLALAVATLALGGSYWFVSRGEKQVPARGDLAGSA
jgi:hypothetical protein